MHLVRLLVLVGLGIFAPGNPISHSVQGSSGPFLDPASSGTATPEPIALGVQGRWRDFPDTFKMLPQGVPLLTFEVTAEFGVRRDPITRRRTMHSGIDLRAPHGSSVHATAPGIVSFAGWAGAYGSLVEVDHGDRVVSRYGHLSRISVRKDEAVVEGQVVGRVGSTGRTTGPHLHYEVVVDGAPRDPAALIREGGALFTMLEQGP